jgi:hypothetical protein
VCYRVRALWWRSCTCSVASQPQLKPLLRIEGISPTRAKALRDAGFKTVEDVAFANAGHVEDVFLRCLRFQPLARAVEAGRHGTVGSTDYDRRCAMQAMAARVVAAARSLLEQQRG